MFTKRMRPAADLLFDWAFQPLFNKVLLARYGAEIYILNITAKRGPAIP